MSLISQFYNHPQKIQMSIFTADGSYSPAVDAWHWFTIIGGGGSGAAAYPTVNSGLTVACCGGNGGSSRGGWVFLKSSETYTVTVGAGGAAVNVPSSGTGQAGAAGGESKLAGGDLASNIVAKGGTGGDFHFGATNGKDYSGVNSVTVENAANAAGSGSGSEALGGKGGLITLDIDTDTGLDFLFATGGGASNVYSVSPSGISGGAIDFNAYGGSDKFCSTGGGGVGGTGGDIDLLDIGSNEESWSTSGGGTATGGAYCNDATASTVPGGIGTGTTEYLEPGGAGGDALFASDTEPFSETIGGIGGGGGGNAPYNSGNWPTGAMSGVFGEGGLFGGGAGVTCVDGDVDISAGTGGASGGGGGGIVSINGAENSGAGGDGVVVLQGFFSPSV